MWIHELKGAGAPQPYNYGREFTNADIDQGLAVHAKDEYHGTHVTGIAAGNGLAVNNYKGVAPNADIIVVSIDFAAGPANSVVDAVDYIYKKAAAMGKPCVINASLGFSEGSHDATDLQSRLIEHLITDKSGRSFVCAAGNSGNIPFHLGCSVNQDTSFTWFKSKNGGISFHLYSDSADFKELQFAIGADQVTPNFSFRGKTIFRNLKSLVDTTIRDTIYYQGKKIAVAEYFTELIDTGKTYLSSITIYPDSTAYYYRLISTGKGKFDVWNNYMVFDNLPDEALFPDIKSYKLPDINQTIVSSFTCSDKVITVGNLVNRTTYTDVNGTIYNDQSLNKGELYVTSSKGPTRRGLIKPDIVASGTNVLSCLPLSMIPSSVVSNPTKVAAGGKHIRNGGTSMASPVVAGVVALYFEKNPNASWKEVKDSLLSSAKRDKYTGNNLPNNYYGYGKVDAWRLFNPPVPQVQTGISESNTNTSLGIYPNPVAENSELIYHISQNTSQGNYFIRFSDILGKEVKRMGLTEGTGVIQLEASEFKAGVYYVSVMNGSKSVTTKKMIVLK